MAEQLPHVTEVTLSEMRPTNGGLSSEMYFCGVTWTEPDGKTGGKKLVMRVRPDFHQVIPDPDAIFQYNLMKRLGERSAVPVPAMWLAEPEGSVIGSPFFFMEQCDGTVLMPAHPSPADPADAEVQPWDAATLSKIYDNALEVLATLHKVDVGDGFDFVGWPGETALDGTLAQTERWYDWAGHGRALGVIDVARQWVFDHKPA
ncbi:MAG: hypothetical protein JWM12_2050, partial [Ilumatobacteraceae bacterium]|nr:hypothetical protein [Ilumatobacteraceae bacterium]